MSKWASLEEAFDTGKKDGAKTFSEELVKEYDIEDIESADEVANGLLKDIPDDNEPFCDEKLTDEESDEYCDGFVTGFCDEYDKWEEENSDDDEGDDDGE